MPYTDNLTLNYQNYNIRGGIFDGQWTYKHLELCNAQTFSPDQQIVYSLDDYLPKDNYNYEVMISFIGNTGNTANQGVYFWARSGSDNNFAVRTCGTVTRTASNENGAGMVIIPIRSSNRNVAFYLESGASASGSCWGYAFAYRRLGTNKWSENNIYRITDNINSYIIGGDILPGRWVVKKADLLYEYSIAASQGEIKTIDLSSCIPDDGYDYECIIDGTAITSATTNQYSSIRVYYPGTNGFYPILETINRSGATQCNYFNLRTPVRASSKTLRLINTGSSITKINVRFEAYRRIGTNV